jgi:hypothetical protein
MIFNRTAISGAIAPGPGSQAGKHTYPGSYAKVIPLRTLLSSGNANIRR